MRCLLLLLLFASLTRADLKVAVLHPLLGDLSRQVGGESVEVIDLLAPGGDPHHFEPSVDQLRDMRDADLFLASGMGLESDLDGLRSMLPANSLLVEVGASLPSIEGSCDDPDHHHHDHGPDPHWWHSIPTYRRAVGVVAEVFAAHDPEQAVRFRENADAYRRKLDALERWARLQVARIPPDRRVLATAHAAFGYLCHDLGFEPIPVAGLNREQMPDAGSLARLITRLREGKIVAIFPEKSSNPKILQALTRETGIGLAEPLDADGTGSDSYEAMVRHNLAAIRQALAPNDGP